MISVLDMYMFFAGITLMVVGFACIIPIAFTGGRLGNTIAKAGIILGITGSLIFIIAILLTLYKIN